jgi:hypothetical protein
MIYLITYDGVIEILYSLSRNCEVTDGVIHPLLNRIAAEKQQLNAQCDYGDLLQKTDGRVRILS